MAAKTPRHRAPREARIPSSLSRKWQAMNAERTSLMERAGALAEQMSNEVRAWATGAGIKIGEGDAPPHYHLAENLTVLRAGKPPEPQVISMEELQALRGKAAPKRKRAKA